MPWSLSSVSVSLGSETMGLWPMWCLCAFPPRPSPPCKTTHPQLGCLWVWCPWYRKEADAQAHTQTELSRDRGDALNSEHILPMPGIGPSRFADCYSKLGGVCRAPGLSVQPAHWFMGDTMLGWLWAPNVWKSLSTPVRWTRGHDQTGSPPVFHSSKTSVETEEREWNEMSLHPFEKRSTTTIIAMYAWDTSRSMMESTA